MHRHRLLGLVYPCLLRIWRFRLFDLASLCRTLLILIFISRMRGLIYFLRRKELSRLWLDWRWLKSWPANGCLCSWQIFIDLWLLWWDSLTRWVGMRGQYFLRFIVCHQSAWLLWYHLIWESKWFREHNLAICLRYRLLLSKSDRFIFPVLLVVGRWLRGDRFYRKTRVIWDRFWSFRLFCVLFHWGNFVLGRGFSIYLCLRLLWRLLSIVRFLELLSFSFYLSRTISISVVRRLCGFIDTISSWFCFSLIQIWSRHWLLLSGGRLNLVMDPSTILCHWECIRGKWQSWWTWVISTVFGNCHHFYHLYYFQKDHSLNF